MAGNLFFDPRELNSGYRLWKSVQDDKKRKLQELENQRLTEIKKFFKLSDRQWKKEKDKWVNLFNGFSQYDIDAWNTHLNYLGPFGNEASVDLKLRLWENNKDQFYNQYHHFVTDLFDANGNVYNLKQKADYDRKIKGMIIPVVAPILLAGLTILAPETLPITIAGIAGGIATDKGVSAISNARFRRHPELYQLQMRPVTGWGDLLNLRFGLDRNIAEFTNPGMLLGGGYASSVVRKLPITFYNRLEPAGYMNINRDMARSSTLKIPSKSRLLANAVTDALNPFKKAVIAENPEWLGRVDWSAFGFETPAEQMLADRIRSEAYKIYLGIPHKPKYFINTGKIDAQGNPIYSYNLAEIPFKLKALFVDQFHQGRLPGHGKLIGADFLGTSGGYTPLSMDPTDYGFKFTMNDLWDVLPFRNINRGLQVMPFKKFYLKPTGKLNTWKAGPVNYEWRSWVPQFIRDKVLNIELSDFIHGAKPFRNITSIEAESANPIDIMAFRNRENRISGVLKIKDNFRDKNTGILNEEAFSKALDNAETNAYLDAEALYDKLIGLDKNKFTLNSMGSKSMLHPETPIIVKYDPERLNIRFLDDLKERYPGVRYLNYLDLL